MPGHCGWGVGVLNVSGDVIMWRELELLLGWSVARRTGNRKVTKPWFDF